jgi:hypothetical protein
MFLTGLLMIVSWEGCGVGPRFWETIPMQVSLQPVIRRSFPVRTLAGRNWQHYALDSGDDLSAHNLLIRATFLGLWRF